MSVKSFSEMTYYSALALKRLGRTAEAAKLLHDLLGGTLARFPNGQLESITSPRPFQRSCCLRTICK